MLICNICQQNKDVTLSQLLEGIKLKPSDGLIIFDKS